MRFSATTTTNSIEGCQQVSVVKTSDGTFRGVWSTDCEDAEFLEGCLENNDSVIEYSL